MQDGGSLVLMPHLLDSDVLIDVSRSRQEAITYVEALPSPWMISQVTALELIVGARDTREVAYLDAFLSAFPMVPLTGAIGRRAYQLLKSHSKSHGLHVFDSLIAATAIEEGLTLVTKNRKHFETIDGLSLEVPTY